MTNTEGAKLIIEAAIFGGFAVLCVTVPFLMIIINGIVKSNQNHTIISTIINALIVHFVSCVAFIAIILALDVVNIGQTDYFSKKIFEIFWAGSDRSRVFELVGGGNSSEMRGAYAILNLVSVIVEFAFSISPILVFVLAVAYGVNLAKKDTYKDSHIEMASCIVISVICCSFLYAVWASIATPALFLPNETLHEMISKFYAEILFK